MPSKSEIKKNPKLPKKATTAKKSVVEAKPKSASKKIAGTNGKVAVNGKARKLSTKSASKSLESKIRISKNSVPTVEQITARAHQMWLEEGCPEGRAQIHWQQAEVELTEL